MSFMASAAVLYADLPIYEKMVLGVLADHADDQGEGAWPSVERIALLSGRISTRQVQRCLRKLEDMRLISVAAEATRHRPTEYRLHLDRIRDLWLETGVTTSRPTSPGVTEGRGRGDHGSPEPIHEPIPPDVSDETSVVPITSAGRKRDLLWEAMEYVMGHSPTTKTERGRWNKAVKELREVGATPDDLVLRATSYRRRWPDIDMTPTGIVANWDLLATAQQGTVTTRLAQLRAAQNETPALDYTAEPCTECGEAPGEVNGLCPRCWDSL